MPQSDEIQHVSWGNYACNAITMQENAPPQPTSMSLMVEYQSGRLDLGIVRGLPGAWRTVLVSCLVQENAVQRGWRNLRIPGQNYHRRIFDREHGVRSGEERPIGRGKPPHASGCCLCRDCPSFADCVVVRASRIAGLARDL